MSMTQEEIEALMSDTSFPQEETSTEDNIDEIDDIDDILAGIDGVIDDGDTSYTNDEEDIDDIIAGIDGIVHNEVEVNDKADVIEEVQNITTNDADKRDKQIDQGVYPLPVSSEHQVVNQLNEVAEDSEKKASQIFDALSFILDENDKIQKNTIEIQKFLDSQLQLLETLEHKFPNIAVFTQNLEEAKNIKVKNTEISNIINDENNKIFEAMELMQYHDINRQKIERVMAVIRKLSNYLSRIFSDDSTKSEVQIAKHISGNNEETVTEDDLDSLIEEFNKKE